jgi:hypothetical protein
MLTWTICELLEGREAVKSKWVHNANLVVALQAQIVTKGYGIDYEQMFS